MTVDDFINRLDQFGESLEDLGPTLESIAQMIEEDLRANYRASGLKTGGPLERSLNADADGNTLTIEMLDYGMYNNYGVRPEPSYVNGGSAPKETYFGTYFRYRNRKFGLPSRQFFYYDRIQQQVVDEIAIQITNNF